MIILSMLVLALLAIGYQFLNLYRQYGFLESDTGRLTEESRKLEKENRKLNNDLSYFADPANLVKELRSKFNYKKPGEKMIIVVPENKGISN